MFKTLGLVTTIVASASAIQWGPTLMTQNARKISNLEEQLQQNNEEMQEIFLELGRLRDRYKPKPLGTAEKRGDKHYASDLEEKLDIEMGYVHARMDGMASKQAAHESHFWQYAKARNRPDLGPVRKR